MTAGSRWIWAAQRWMVFAACVAAWQVVADAAASPFFPAPTAIAGAIGDLWLSGPPDHLFLTSGVAQDIVPSLLRMLGAWLMAVVSGIALGIAIGLLPRVADYCSPLLAFMRALPPIMLVPLFLDLFHIGTPMQLATITFGSVWPVLLNAVDGARSVDRIKIETARAFRITRARWVGMVVLPTAMPKIFAGLRLSLQFALILMVFSEFVGAVNGIGFRLFSANQTFRYPTMWAAIVVMGLLGYVLNRLLVAVEHRSLGWHRRSMQPQEG